MLIRADPQPPHPQQPVNHTALFSEPQRPQLRLQWLCTIDQPLMLLFSQTRLEDHWRKS